MSRHAKSRCRVACALQADGKQYVRGQSSCGVRTGGRAQVRVQAEQQGQQRRASPAIKLQARASHSHPSLRHLVSTGAGRRGLLGLLCRDGCLSSARMCNRSGTCPPPLYATVVLVRVSTLPSCSKEALVCSVVPTGICNCTRLESAPPHLGGLILRLLNALIRSAAAPREHLQQVSGKSLVLARACHVGHSDVNCLCSYSDCSPSIRC